MNAEPCPRCGRVCEAGVCWTCAARDLLDESPTNERRLGDYLLEDEIARGGMGIVYRAWQLSLDRPVAVKVLREGLFAGGQEAARFRQEAAAAAALRHPGLVPVIECGESNGRAFYAMEWIDGPNLADRTAEHPVSARQAAEWTRDVALAVQHAHEHGVVHRDLKPANVLLDGEGRVRVTDFGMAQRADTASGLTMTGQVLGTPGYMAPELAAGTARTAGAAADIYGLGALLFHLLTGRAPFIGESATAILQQLAEADAISPRLFNPSIPRDLETICLKALAREPARRFASAREMAEDLARFFGGEPICARPVSSAERAWRWGRREPVLAASLAAIVLLLASVAVLSLWSARRFEKARAAEAAGRREARQNLYAADVRMAGQLYEKGALEAARRLLDGHIPAPGEEDLRGFDWRILRASLAGDQTRKAALPFAPVGDDAPISPDGKWALLSEPARAAIVELETQRVVAEWPEGRGRGFFLRQLLWSEAARCLIATGDRVRLIEPQTGGVTLLGEGGAEVAAVSPGGSMLAIGPARIDSNAPPSRVELWEIASRRAAGTIALPSYPRALTWTPDGAQLVVGLYPRTIQWWRPGESAPSRTLKLSPPGAAANMPWAWFSPDANLAVIAWWDSEGAIALHDLQDGRVVARLPGLAHGAARFAWSADGRWLAGSGSEQSILLWERDRWAQSHWLRGPLGYTGGLAFLGSETLVAVSADRAARWWTIPPREAPPLFPNDMTGSHVWRPAWSPDGTLVTLARRFGINSDDHTMRGVLWDCARQAPRFEWDEIGVAFSPDGRRVFTVERNTIYRWRDTTTGAEVRRFTLAREGALRLPRVSPDGRWMVAWHESGEGVLYEIESGRAVATLDGGSEAAFSPDSRWLAREANRRLILRDLVTGAERATDVPCHLAVTWSPDGRTLATRFDSNVHLVDAATGARTATLAGGTSRLGVMLFLPDRRTLLTTGEDGSLRLWNLPTRRETHTLAKLESCAFYCAASPDGRSLLVGGVNGYRFFTLPADDPGSPGDPRQP